MLKHKDLRVLLLRWKKLRSIILIKVILKAGGLREIVSGAVPQQFF